MQQPKLNLIQRMQDAFATEIMKRQFPVDTLSMDWKKAALKALEYASPYSLGVSAEIFKKLALMVTCSKDYKLSFFEFATLSNNLEARSAKELDMPMQEYVALVIEANSQVKYYSEEVEKIRKEVNERVVAEDAAENAAKKTTEGEPAFGGLKAES
jgi:TRAP-type mannitol/chloroaromatic compound transport system substrate-binding protein